MKVELNPAFVLHRRLYRETSLLLDIFSREYGRVSLIARGVRQAGNSKSELLQPNQPLLLSWSGKSDLMNLVSVEQDGMPYRLKKDKLIAGFYINELVMRLLHSHEAHADLFDSYKKTLGLLGDDSVNEQVALRIFEKKLMESVGYGLAMEYESGSNRAIEPDVTYYYQADRGASRMIPDTGDYIRVTGRVLISLASEDFSSEDELNNIKKLMRYVLKKHLGDKPLASRDLYESYIHQSRI